MKIIDLLNKISNGEKVPMFEYENHLFKYNEKEKWFDDLKDDSYCKSEAFLCELNNEINIIEDTQIEEYQKALDETMSEKIDLQYRIHKAIEYIGDSFYEVGGRVGGSDLPYQPIQDLLNILKGDKDD